MSDGSFAVAINPTFIAEDLSMQSLNPCLPLGNGLTVMDQLPGQAMDPVVLGGDHQTRVKVKPWSDARADREKASDLSAGAVIDFGRICNDQETLPGCPLGKLTMGSGNRLKGDILTVKEIVRSPQIVPGFGLFGKTPGDAARLLII